MKKSQRKDTAGTIGKGKGDSKGSRRRWYPAHLKGWTTLQGERT